MSEQKNKIQKELKRLKRTRAKVLSLARRNEKPRLSVFRSNKYIYAQIINDVKGVTLVSVSERELEDKKKLSKIEKAAELGKLIAKKAKDKKIKDIIFDKGAYKFHGRVKAFAEAARAEGLNF